MAIYSEFSHKKWWFSIVMLVYQRDPEGIEYWYVNPPDLPMYQPNRQEEHGISGPRVHGKSSRTSHPPSAKHRAQLKGKDIVPTGHKPRVQPATSHGAKSKIPWKFRVFFHGLKHGNCWSFNISSVSLSFFGMFPWIWLSNQLAARCLASVEPSMQGSLAASVAVPNVTWRATAPRKPGEPSWTFQGSLSITESHEFSTFFKCSIISQQDCISNWMKNKMQEHKVAFAKAQVS